jgi:hypothetical protein
LRSLIQDILDSGSPTERAAGVFKNGDWASDRGDLSAEDADLFLGSIAAPAINALWTLAGVAVVRVSSSTLGFGK